MLKLMCIIFSFVYLIISKIHLQTQYVLMFTFIANYFYFKTNKHTYTPAHTDKHTMIHPHILQIYQSVLD